MGKQSATALGFFAGELRRARTGAGLNQRALGEAVSYSESLVAMVETGRRTPSRDFAKRCDAALGTDGLLARIHEDLVSRELAHEWFRPWIDLERQATALRWYEPELVHGLLQTEEYARAVLRGSRRLTEEELDRQVVARLERQAILTGEKPPLFIAIIDEAALRRPIGGPKVMRDQLTHLVEAVHSGWVRLQVVPGSAGMYPGLNGSFVWATLGEDGDVGFLDGPLRGHIVENVDDIDALQRSWEDVRCEALPMRQSIELITKVAESWT